MTVVFLEVADTSNGADLTTIDEFLTSKYQTEGNGNANKTTLVDNAELHEEINMKNGGGQGKFKIAATSMTSAKAWARHLASNSKGAVQN